MNVKIDFLNGVIQEEVYVRQPPDFENPKYVNRVYELSKALYGLKRGPRTWYAKIKIFLLDHRYVTGNVDKTLFTFKCGNDFLLLQIYVNDIIFGGSSHVPVLSFQEIIENEFQMSMIEELIFFLGIHVKKMKHVTFVHQAKYTKDLMKKFNMAELNPVSTPMSMIAMLDPDENGETIDQREYRSMIDSLLYLRQHDRTFSLLCACFQASPCISHRQAVQRIFRYLKSTLEFRIWYSASSLIDLMLILWVVELTKKALLVHVIFLDLLLFIGLLANNLLLHNPPQRLSM
jgi:hypothetical protein